MEKNISKNDKNNILNKKNYNISLNNTIYYNSINIYINIGNQCVKYLLSNLKTTNSEYLNFIINRGLKTLENVQNFLFMYTKNDKLIEHHLEKAYLYYVEFVTQIGEDSNSFIKLNSKDATLFVYKKTIYDIEQDYRKNMNINPKDDIYIKKMIQFTNIYNTILSNIIHIGMNDIESKEDKLKIYMKYNKNFGKIITNIYNIFSNKDFKNFTQIIKIFDEDIVEYVCVEKYIKLLTLFTNKYIKTELSYANFDKKTHDINKKIYIQNTPLKYVNWIFN